MFFSTQKKGRIMRKRNKDSKHKYAESDFFPEQTLSFRIIILDSLIPRAITLYHSITWRIQPRVSLLISTVIASLYAPTFASCRTCFIFRPHWRRWVVIHCCCFIDENQKNAMSLDITDTFSSLNNLKTYVFELYK